MAQTAHAGDNVERFGAGHAGREPQDHDQRDDHHHIVTPLTYIKIIVVLMVLLIITVLAANIEMGVLNVPIAIAIATVKAVLIMMYFMHLKYSSKLVWIFAGVAFVFVGIMFALTLSDYFTRDWLFNPGH
ncbi:MAG TPA: cytochrome C oxidase subunit IV family protein [Abditibacteriaceae bacterium]|jgi:cytochrome c oxidase subunit 4